MISDILSEAVDDIEQYQEDVPEAYAELAAEIDVVKVVIHGLRMVLDVPPGQSDEFQKLVRELRSEVGDLDISRLVAARERLLAWVEQELARQPKTPEFDPSDLPDSGWHHVGSVTIDTGRLLLLDPVHQGRVDPGAGDGQIAIPGGDLSAVQVPTGIGDGRYRVEARGIDSPIFGKRIAEIRVRFLDEDGNWLGGD